MLPLDHIPFHDPDPDALARGFGKLGFTASPASRYTSPDHPGAAWQGRCVFLRSGWLDLLCEPSPRRPGAPAACVFRTPDLAGALTELADLSPEPATRLERRWEDHVGLPPESFAYAGLRSRIAPTPLAVIQHAWPCPDIRPEWFEHANGARAVEGLIFGGEAPGPAATAAARGLDLTGFEYWPLDRFEAAFAGAPARRALRLRTDDLARTRAVLEAAGARFSEAADGIAVPPQFGVNCGVLFRG